MMELIDPQHRTAGRCKRLGDVLAAVKRAARCAGPRPQSAQNVEELFHETGARQSRDGTHRHRRTAILQVALDASRQGLAARPLEQADDRNNFV